jgi:uncharacterized membrane protein
VQLSDLLKGFPGHPFHPPLTDLAVGLYTGATACAILSSLGVSEGNLATAWWLALVGGLIVTVPTALTGFVEWLSLERGTPLFRTATVHFIVMVSATVCFLIAASAGHGDYVDRTVGGGAFVFTLIGYGLLAFGGWLGGSLVFTYGLRVLNLVHEPATRAAVPGGEEKEEAAQ